MAIEEGVKCPNCGHAVVPRLWLTGERNPIAYWKTRHLCPYCGAVMYERGGGVNWTAVTLLLIVFGACALVLLMLVLSRR